MFYTSDETYKAIFYRHPIPMILFDPKSFNIVESNEAVENLYGYTRSELLQILFSDLFSSSDFSRLIKSSNDGQYEALMQQCIWHNFSKNKHNIFAKIHLTDIIHHGNTLKMATVLDVTSKTIDQENSKLHNDKYQLLTEDTFDAIWDWDLKTGHLKWNESAKKMFEIQDYDVIEQPGWWSANLHPEDKKRVEEKLVKNIAEKITHWHEEYRFKSGSENYKYILDKGYLVYDGNSTPVRMVGAMQDLTRTRSHEKMLQSLNDSLEKRAKELAESNEELERFAYVASHDLQEPLRMVTSFLQLLEKKYKNKLDNKAQEYINYAVVGAERMKKLILDLLEYSRVNAAPVEKTDVDLIEIMDDIQFTFRELISSTHASLLYENLPVVKGNKTQLSQLFQNLIENAIKYRSEDSPVIKISFTEDLYSYTFSIKDNGIGIDPRFYNKIFIIFQRLHTREQYSGTGIGLAICKKIIDKHSGKIWVSSKPGVGSTFYLTIPKS